MSKEHINRRKFNSISAAAFGGLIAGSVVGCGEGDSASPPESQGGAGDGDTVVKIADHACRGLNECKTDKNACAGQSACANVEPHDCHAHNSCKNLGGCGDTAGANACKGQGECAVPMAVDSDVWKSARAAFEKRMKEAKKSFGNPPAVKSPTKD